jgi:23S rRNA-/tRNA-specific pseudouridylate synthase
MKMTGPTLDPSAILYEDEDLIAVNKPPGFPSQATRDPNRPHLEKALREFMIARDSVRDVYLGMHQRLDRDTSGVIVFTKTKRANAGLAEQVASHRIQKIYWAIAAVKNPVGHDQIPHHESLPKTNWNSSPGSSTDCSLGAAWTIKNHLAPAPKKSSREQTRQMSVRSGGDFAETTFRILALDKDASLIESRPRTGRMHQIRVHLAEDGRPILGDALYAPKSIVCRAPRVMLHARALELEHPVTRASLAIEAPLPRDFTTLLRTLGLHI